MRSRQISKQSCFPLRPLGMGTSACRCCPFWRGSSLPVKASWPCPHGHSQNVPLIWLQIQTSSVKLTVLTITISVTRLYHNELSTLWEWPLPFWDWQVDLVVERTLRSSFRASLYSQELTPFLRIAYYLPGCMVNKGPLIMIHYSLISSAFLRYLQCVRCPQQAMDIQW